MSDPNRPSNGCPTGTVSDKYRQLFEMESDAVFLVDNATGAILEANSAAETIYGFTREELLGKKHTDLSAEPDQTRQATEEGHSYVPLRYHRKKDGAVFPVEIKARFCTWEGRSVQVAVIRDISSRVVVEERARRALRALRALSQCNQALIQAVAEHDLLTQVCAILTTTGGYRLTWVGYRQQDAAQTVRPVAQAGFEAGYLETVNVTWADTERGRGPMGTAVRTARPLIIRDIPTDPRFAPWQTEAARRGYASCIGVPLLEDGSAFGALAVYAPEPDAFDAEEVDLLVELAGNLAYGIRALRDRTARREAEEALRRSHERLEQLIEDRTAELRIANVELREEIAQRKRAEQTLRKLLDVYEQHRRLVAYEIHDAVAQPLAATLMVLEGLLSELQAVCPEANREGFAPITALLRKALGESRRLMSGLGPLILEELGLLAAIDSLLDEARAADQMTIEYRAEVRFARLASPLETAVFRILQESLANAYRHSRSPRVRIALVQEGERLRIEVEDWGIGFDPNRVDPQRFGLQGIRERARLFGGQAEIRSAPGQGTQVRVELPIVEADQARGV